jgi:GAF domain-containing protein
VEPVPETTEALAQLEDVDPGLLEALSFSGRQVIRIAPDCIGMSVAASKDGVVFTLVASDQGAALLDAVQYIGGGPCVEAMEGERVLEADVDDITDEASWHLFAQAAAEAGIASTLTLPIIAGGRVVGTVNLYGATADAFSGRHEDLAEVFHAWAPGAVTNADLSFRTREAARTAPRRLAEETTVNQAVGVLVAAQHLDPEAARNRIKDAALRSGLPEAAVAEGVLRLWLHDGRR